MASSKDEGHGHVVQKSVMCNICTAFWHWQFGICSTAYSNSSSSEGFSRFMVTVVVVDFFLVPP